MLVRARGPQAAGAVAVVRTVHESSSQLLVSPAAKGGNVIGVNPMGNAAPDNTWARLQLFGGPCVVIAGERGDIPDSAARMLALLAFRRGRIDRGCLSGQLWPEVAAHWASGSLMRVALQHNIIH